MLSPLPPSPYVRRQASFSQSSEDRNTRHAQEEEKEERKASFLFALTGIGYLFPFSALTQPVDYWQILFPDFNIEFQLTSTFMYTNIVFLGLIVLFLGSPWYTGRIVGGFTGQLLVLAFIPTSYFFLSSETANTIAVLGGTAAASIATAFIDSATITLVSHYPLRVQESFQLGVGISTLIGSIYRDLTKVVFPDDMVVTSTLIYFYTGAFTIALCIAAYYNILGLKITKKYLNVKPHTNGVEMTETSSLLPQDTRELQDEASSPQSETSVGNKAPTKRSVLHKVLSLQLLIALNFTTSLCLWPPLLTEIRTSSFPYLQQSGWWSLILLTVFSLWDCIGRFMVRMRCGLTATNIWIPIVLRIAFVPIFIGMVRGVWFTHDAWALLFTSILGHTNGYLGTLAIIFVNESVHEEEQKIAGPFTSFFLNLGLVLGSSVGLVLQKVVVG